MTIYDKLAFAIWLGASVILFMAYAIHLIKRPPVKENSELDTLLNKIHNDKSITRVRVWFK